MTADERFFFVHMQKTAGTALHQRLKRQFDPAQIYPGPGDGRPPESVLLVDHLQRRFDVRRHEIRVVTGHFPLCTTELLDAEFRTFTLLRDPVERTLSYLRHHRKLTPADRDRSMEAIYEDPLRFHGLIHNHMTKMLCLDADSMSGSAMTHVDFEPRHLDVAVERLRGVDVVGLQHRFEEFCQELSSRFGWQLGPDLVANRTDPVEVSTSFRERIAEDNALDMELFAAAEQLVADRAAGGRSPDER